MACRFTNALYEFSYGESVFFQQMALEAMQLFFYVSELKRGQGVPWPMNIFMISFV